MSKRKVGIIGSICDKMDGQTVKTKILYDELNSKTDWDFYIANTQNKSKHPIKLLLQTIKLIVLCKDIFILVSQNGAKIYFPLLYYAKKIFHNRIYHDVIGGSPEDYIDYNPKNKKYLNSFAVNWVETKQMCIDLEKEGVNNAEELPNFKNLKIVSENELINTFDEVLPLCTFSRVMKEKGIEDAIEAVESLNWTYGRKVFRLDIYGLIEESYKEEFDSIMSNCSDAIRYCGLIPYDQSVSVVKNYYALLFPTFWFGEGFPGTIVDAFSSGVPVIATDWSANKEIIENYKTGLIYPNDECKTLIECLEWAQCNRKLMTEMRRNCIKKAIYYQPDEHIKKIIERVDKNEKNNMYS